MPTAATTVAEYLDALTPDRRAELQTVREVLLRHLPAGYQEGIQYGMIGYFVPHTLYPHGYHCDAKQPLPFAALGAQKHHLALHLMGLYMNDEASQRFQAAWQATGKKLDMGKACLRFKRADDLALEVLAETVAAMTVERYVAVYEAKLPEAVRRKR